MPLSESHVLASKLQEATIEYLKWKKRVLFLTTSNRWSDEAWGELPKSTQLAYELQKRVWEDRIHVIDVTKLNIYPCEWNVSTERWNTCGEKKSKLQDLEKNPSWFHRCWASMNNPDDELWEISKSIFESQAVVFFTSIRWWQTNSYYQKLIERLTWIENRQSTLWEDNIVGNIDAGVIVVNQNWRGQVVLKTQKEVLSFFGFKTPEVLSWNWQYTKDSDDESQESYKKAAKEFKKIFLKK